METEFDLLAPEVKESLSAHHELFFIDLTPWGFNKTEVNIQQKIEEALQNKGIFLIKFPEGFLYANQTQYLREKYIKQDIIYKIVLFPNYQSKVVYILFDKQKQTNSKGIIKFEEITKEKRAYKKVNVSVEEIKEQGYNLSINRYFHPRLDYLKQEIAQNKAILHPLLSITERIIVGRTYPQEQILTDSQEDYPYIAIRDLSSAKNAILDTTNTRKIKKEGFRGKKIDYSCVLVSLVHNKLYPTYFEYQGQAIVTMPYIAAIEVKTDMVNIDYLIEQLNSDFVKIQLEMLVNGIFNKISTRDLEGIKIILPTLSEQKERLLAIQKERIKAITSEIENTKIEVRTAEYDIMSEIVHNLNQKLGTIQNGLDLLTHFLKEKDEKGSPVSLDEPVVPIFEENTIEQIESFKLKNVLQNLKIAHNYAAKYIKDMREDVQNNTVKPILTKLKDFFEKNVKPHYQTQSFDFEVSGENVKLEIDQDRIEPLVSNLVNNAKQHGKATKIVFYFQYTDKTKEYVRIVCKNNGKPFHKNFDFEETYKVLYGKSADSKGTGIGGRTISKIIELHRGEMYNTSAEAIDNEIYPVQITFILPTQYTKNPYYTKSNPYS